MRSLDDRELRRSTVVGDEMTGSSEPPLEVSAVSVDAVCVDVDVRVLLG